MVWLQQGLQVSSVVINCLRHLFGAVPCRSAKDISAAVRQCTAVPDNIVMHGWDLMSWSVRYSLATRGRSVSSLMIKSPQKRWTAHKSLSSSATKIYSSGSCKVTSRLGADIGGARQCGRRCAGHQLLRIRRAVHAALLQRLEHLCTASIVCKVIPCRALQVPHQPDS